MATVSYVPHDPATYSAWKKAVAIAALVAALAAGTLVATGDDIRAVGAASDGTTVAALEGIHPRGHGAFFADIDLPGWGEELD